MGVASALFTGCGAVSCFQGDVSRGELPQSHRSYRPGDELGAAVHESTWM